MTLGQKSVIGSVKGDEEVAGDVKKEMLQRAERWHSDRRMSDSLEYNLFIFLRFSYFPSGYGYFSK